MLVGRGVTGEEDVEDKALATMKITAPGRAAAAAAVITHFPVASNGRQSSQASPNASTTSSNAILETSRKILAVWWNNYRRYQEMVGLQRHMWKSPKKCGMG